jgi:hypothetical protein
MDMTGQIAALADGQGLKESRRWGAERQCQLRWKSAPLTFAQQWFYSFAQIHPGQPLLNNSLALRVTGIPDASAIQLSLDAMMARHETLRTRFQCLEGEPVALTGPAESVEFSHFDLSSDPQSETAWQAILREQAWRPFDLSSDRLFRAALVHLDRSEHILLLTTHQIAADHESWRVILGEFASLYECFSEGRRVALPVLPMRFTDFAREKQISLQGMVISRKIKQLKRQLGGKLTRPLLPYDFPSLKPVGYDGASQSRPLTHSLADALGRLGCREGVPLRTVLLTAFQTLLFRYSDQSDFTLGVGRSGRQNAPMETLVGPYASLVALRSQCQGRPSFRQLLRRVHDAFTQATGGPEIPFERLVADLQPSPPLAAVFNWHDFLKDSPSPATLELVPHELPVKHARFDLTLSIQNWAGGLKMRLEYQTSLFRPATICRLLEEFEMILQNAVAQPDCPITIPSVTV